MKNSTVQDAEHGADCRCNECLFEGPEVESTDELIAKGWLKPEDIERDKPPVVLHRLHDWLSEDDLPDAWQLPRMLPAGAVTLFSADPKCGKAQLMLAAQLRQHRAGCPGRTGPDRHIGGIAHRGKAAINPEGTPAGRNGLRQPTPRLVDRLTVRP